MSTWNGKAGAGAAADFVHVDGAGTGTSASDKSSSTGASKGKAPSSSQRGRASQLNGNFESSQAVWHSTIIRLTDSAKPEDTTAIHKLGEDVRAAGIGGARAAVEVLRARIQDKNVTPETRARAIAIARVLAQRSGLDAQRFIAAPLFVNSLKLASSDPNIRGLLKTWASQIRIGDPKDATVLSSITGLDEHLTQVAESMSQSPESTGRPVLNTNGPSYAPHAPPSGEDPDESLRAGARAHVTGNRNTGESVVTPSSFGPPMPGGFGADETGPTTGAGGPLPLREFPASSIQPFPPSIVTQPVSRNARAGWGDDDDGVQSDAPSARSRRTNTQQFSGATSAMDSSRGARDRLSDRALRNGNGQSLPHRTSSLVDGTLSESEEPEPRGRQTVPTTIATTSEDPRVYKNQRVPMPAQRRGRSRQPSVSPSPDTFRSRSQSPSTATSRSRRASRSRAQSRRRGAGPITDPAAVLVNLSGVRFVRVIQEYYATREGELTLHEGEVLAVIRQEDGGRYWLGHSQGRFGVFPADVVELLSHQSRNQSDSAPQEEKTARLLRRMREIDDFMDQLHEFDITRFCVTEDQDIQSDLALLLNLRNEIVRHLDETTTGLGRLKAMLNRIKEAQRIHDRMIDSRIASYTARSSLHDATPRNPYQELPANSAQYPFDMSQYMRRTAPQIEQPPPGQPHVRQQPQLGMYNGSPAAKLRYRQAQELGYTSRPGIPPRARTYSYTPASSAPQPPPRRMDDEHSSAYISSEPPTPGETSSAAPTTGTPVNGGAPQYGYQVPQSGGERWAEHPKDVDPNAARQRTRDGSHIEPENSTRAPRRNGF